MSFTAAASTLDHTEIVKGFANGLVGISENKTHLTDKVRWMAAHSADVAVVAVSPDGQTFASASLDGTVYVCRFDGGAGLGASFRAEAPLMKCAIRADGKTIVVVETTGVAHVLNDLLNAPIQPLPRDFATAAIECIPAPDWNSLFLLYPGSLVVRSVDTGTERTIVSGLWGNEEALVTSVDGARVSLRCGTELKIWDVESGSLVRSWPAVRNDARMMPDGRAILDRPSCASSGLALFDVQTGSLKVTLSEVTSADRIEVSAEGRWVVASESGPSRENSPPPAVWDTTTGKMMDFGRRSQFGHFLGHWFGAVDQGARVWDLSTGECVFYGHAYERSFTAWAAMPDDRGIVVGFGDGRLGIWELDGKSTVRRLPGHSDLVAAIAVHPNGQTIVSASRDGVLNVCMVESGALTATCQLSGPLGACIIRPDGKTVVAVTKNGRVYVMPDLLSGQAGTNR
jgi:WD40 repeat protein